jgi:hypothetical protein
MKFYRWCGWKYNSYLLMCTIVVGFNLYCSYVWTDVRAEMDVLCLMSFFANEVVYYQSSWCNLSCWGRWLISSATKVSDDQLRLRFSIIMQRALQLQSRPLKARMTHLVMLPGGVNKWSDVGIRRRWSLWSHHAASFCNDGGRGSVRQHWRNRASR